MKLHHVLLLSTVLSMVAGCVSQPDQRAPEPARTWSSLVVDGVAQNRLADRQLPVQGWTSLEIVIRGGSHDGAAGVFVDINGNERFVSWLDLTADPLGQRFYSDTFIKAGELRLRVSKGSCGGRMPLVFQVRELRPKVQPIASAGAAAIDDISYEPLSDWDESGLYLPDRLTNRIDARWDDQTCQPALAPAGATSTQHASVQSHCVRPAVSNQQVAVKRAPEPEINAKPPLDPYGKPCRLCRKDDTGDDYGGGDKWQRHIRR